MRRAHCIIAASLSCALTVGTALGAPKSVTEATTADKNAAAAAYRKAMADFDKNDLEKALEGFRRSYDIVRSPNSHFMIARTLARLGRNVEAYEELNGTIAEADGLGDKYEDTVHAAYAKLDEIKPRIGFVVVTVANAPKGTVAVVGDETIDEKRFGKQVPALPGETTVTVTPPGKAKRTQKVTVEAGSEATVRFDLSAPPPEEAPPEPVWHAPYFVEVEAEFGGETLSLPYPATRGVGPGVRASFPVMPRGFVGNRDNFAISTGVDWILTSTDPHFLVPLELQWNFWVTEAFSVRVEPGAAVQLGAGNRVVPSVYAGARYRIWKQLYVHGRIGVPLGAAGLSMFW